MKRQEIVDESGKKIPCHYRDGSGGIVVSDNALLNKYIIEKNHHLKIETLQKEMDEIKFLLKELIKNGKSNLPSN